MPKGTGSRISRLYIDDSGAERTCILDRSNTEGAALGFTDNLESNSDRRAVMSGTPRPGVVMRQVSGWRTNENGEMVRRKFPIGTPTRWAELASSPNPSVTVGGETYFITAFIGEKRYLAPVQDTGITDAVPASP